MSLYVTRPNAKSEANLAKLCHRKISQNFGIRMIQVRHFKKSQFNGIRILLFLKLLFNAASISRYNSCIYFSKIFFCTGIHFILSIKHLRWLEILGMLPKTVRLAFLTVILPDEISVPDLLQLNSNTIAMLKVCAHMP